MQSSALIFDPPIEGGLVAAFDGSGPGGQVLEWAVTEAAAHGEPLHVVRAWSVADAAPDVRAPFGIVPSVDECRAVVAADAEQRVGEARVAAGDPDVRVHVHAVHAPADVALEAASQRARLLVVGHRGRSRLQLVLGSVTEHLLSHAGCPVAVIRLDRR